MSRRALHFVLKIGDRRSSIEFFKNVLGMTTLRHEEFDEGCKATCNGPYDTKWSKTMVGYGPEDNHFVLELTYNYGIGAYALGNDLQGITINSKAVSDRAAAIPDRVSSAGVITIREPGGYPFHIVSQDQGKPGDEVVKVSLSVSDINKSHDFWVNLLGMQCLEKSDSKLLLVYSEGQAFLELVKVDGAVDHGKAFGRIAFSCDREELMKDNKQTIHTPYVSLDTPGKATVEVVILADPDGHEICFVGDKAFRELSQVDPKADELLSQAMEADKSVEWYSKKGKSKEEF